MPGAQSSGDPPQDETRSLETPGEVSPPALEAPTSELSRSPSDESFTLGRYILAHRLGSGGFGIVYAARDEELDRSVALKFVRPTRADGRSAMRLVREARAMAQLSHPNVASVFDVGTYDEADFSDGWPPELPSRGVYIVMELIEGGSLREWLAREERGWEAVLGQMIPAGRGLAAAHEQGILHRDFKPTNVLLGSDHRPRVVDFGLARALAGPDTGSVERSSDPPPSGGTLGIPSSSSAADGRPELDPDQSTAVIASAASPLDLVSLTATGAAAGTPAYMAPEQLAGGKVGAWTDQYNFCVALYEGLYGQRPFVASTVGEMIRLKRAGDVPAAPAKTLVPSRVRTAVLRGLAPEPDARWGSMAALLRALEPRPARRRWWLPASGLLIGGGVAAWLLTANRTTGCEEGAQRAKEIWNDTQRTAVQRALIATGTKFGATSADKIIVAVDDYVDDWTEVRGSACNAAAGESAALFDVQMRCLRDGLESVQSLTEVLVEADAGVATRGLEVVARLPPPRDCLEPRGTGSDAPPPAELAPEVNAVRNRLMRLNTLRAAGRAAEVRGEGQDALAEARRLGFPPLTARALVTLGNIDAELGLLDDAENTLTQGYYSALEAGDDARAAEAAVRLVAIKSDQRFDYAAAESWAKHAESRLERGGRAPAVESNLAASLGFMAENRGQLSEAADHYRRSRDMLVPALGENHLDVSLAEQNLGRVIYEMGHRDEGLRTMHSAMKKASAFLGSDHPQMSSFESAIGVAYLEQGAYERAVGFLERAVDVLVDGYGHEHPDYAGQASNLANGYMALGRYDDALRLYDSATASAERILGPGHPVIGMIAANVGQIRLLQRDPRAAQQSFERALTIFTEHHGELHPNTAEALGGIGRSLLQQGKYEQSRERHEQALRIIEQTLGPDHFEVSTAVHDVALTYLEAGRYAEAIDPLQRALAMRETETVVPAYLAESKLALAQAMFGTQDGTDDAQALRYAREARDLLEQAGSAGELLRPDLEQVLRAHDPEFEAP